ncbi:MAG: branched-chain amino acid ABC transporter permease [Verrucomicrobiota bacterium]
MLEYLINILILIGIYGILALSLNLVVGYTGLLSLAHAGFYGIGAYVTAIAATRYGFDFFSSMILGAAISFFIAGFFGIVLSKFKGDMYALASLGLGMIVFSVLLNWQSFTNGPLGIPGISRPSIGNFSFTTNAHFLLLVMIFLAATYLLCWWLTKSHFGRVLKSIREKEEVTQLLGYKTFYYKLAAFQISAAISAVAGSLFASYLSFINPFNFHLNESIFITVIIIVGGLASLRGSLLGAVILILVPELLRFLGMPPEIAAQVRQFLYGLALILLMIFRPVGIMGRYRM